jgi:hypothetical protein
MRRPLQHSLTHCRTFSLTIVSLETSKRATSVSVVVVIMVTGDKAVIDKVGTSEAAREHIIVEI